MSEVTRRARELEVVLHTVEGAEVAAVYGELDLDTRERFERALEPLRNADAPVVLDLGELSFIDSSGLHAVVRLWRARRSEGRALAVACRQPVVRKIFELTSLDAMVPLYDDVPAAVCGEGGGGPPVSARAS